jgi:3'-phosphoadenosine 5'-phosphosulfate sulfotransferase (PAPS reductase)/FAD synthetase
MTHWISFSGGLGSAASALIAKIHDYDFEMIMADTAIEDEDLWRFSDDVARFVGKELIILRTGKTPWDVYEEKRWIGNTRTAHCSEVLKTIPVRQFLDKFAKPDDPLVLGMNFGELDRIDRARSKWSPRPVKSLLCDYGWGDFTIREAFSLIGIEIPRLYKMGFPHNNCGGFCCKAGLKQFATLLDHMPDRFAEHETRMENTMQAIGGTAKPFLRKTSNGETNYLTLREFREGYEVGDIKPGTYDYGGCGCFTE